MLRHLAQIGCFAENGSGNRLQVDETAPDNQIQIEAAFDVKRDCFLAVGWSQNFSERQFTRYGIVSILTQSFKELLEIYCFIRCSFKRPNEHIGIEIDALVKRTFSHPIRLADGEARHRFPDPF